MGNFAIAEDLVDLNDDNFNSYAHVLMVPGRHPIILWRNEGFSNVRGIRYSERREENRRLYASYNNVIADTLKKNVPRDCCVYTHGTYAYVHHDMIQALKNVVEFKTLENSPRVIDRYFIKAHKMVERYAKEAHEHTDRYIHTTIEDKVV
jgi:hypothetical protein